MFQISDEPIVFTWPVEYVRPDPMYAGKYERINFQGKFTLVDNETWLEINNRLAVARERMASNPSEEAIADLILEDSKAMKKIFQGWEEGQIKDSAGQDVPVNDSTINDVLNLAGMTQAISRAYADARSGAPSKARKKT